MNVEIERIAITLQDVHPDAGAHIADLLRAALERELSDMAEHGARMDTEHADLGAIEAPMDADGRTLTDLIASRVAAWIHAGEAR